MTLKSAREMKSENQEATAAGDECRREINSAKGQEITLWASECTSASKGGKEDGKARLVGPDNKEKTCPDKLRAPLGSMPV